jgi:hypothetical protein
MVMNARDEMQAFFLKRAENGGTLSRNDRKGLTVMCPASFVRGNVLTLSVAGGDCPKTSIASNRL